MNSDKITIQDIADIADVSIATVSRIINRKDNVKPATKQKVLKAMEQLNFSPKSLFSLSAADSKIILICIPDLNNPFNNPIISGIQKAADNQGYDVLILQARNLYTDSNDYTNILKYASISGILILASVPRPELLSELALRCPVVMCSEYAEDYGISFVSIDDVAAARKAVNYLISTGRKKIGFINGNINFKYSRHREKGYLDALNAAGLETIPAWLSHLSIIDYQLGFSSAYHMLSLPNRPDAIFACSDLIAAGVINAAHQLNLNVPYDVSVIGFDNIELTTMITPTITTIEQPSFQIGYQSCELLIEKISNPQTEIKQILLDTELIVRNSTVLSI